MDEKLEAMSDTPKFEVIDRRKMKAEEEQERGAGRARQIRRRQQCRPRRPRQPQPGPRLARKLSLRRDRGWW